MESENLVQQLLTGSKRINEMREEIDTIVGMTFGFLNKRDKSRFKNGESIDFFTIASLRWQMQKCKGSLGIYITQHETNRIIYVWGFGDRLSLEHVQLIHACLQNFLAKMIKIFPELENRFASLLKAAAME